MQTCFYLFILCKWIYKKPINGWINDDIESEGFSHYNKIIYKL